MEEEKIFGIGLSRTGTTSLTAAFKVLEYRSIHYPGFYFKNLLTVKIAENELENYETLTDVPVAYIFKELDVQYPNAKFILTVRDDESWLKSVRKFFTRPEGNSSKGRLVDFLRCLKPKNKHWRRVYVLRHLVYGAFKFNDRKYLKGYQRHNAEVQDYFKGRENKLLVVNLIKEENKWDKICAFIGKPIPETAFPHKNNAHILNK
jgi:hypothetical protein